MKINQEIIDEMLAALTANINYLSQNGNAQIRVRNGRLLDTIADKYIYEFTLEFLQNIEPDAEVEIRINNTSASGKVSALNETSIQVELDKNLGTNIPEALLIVSSYYLLEMLKSRLEKIDNGEIVLSNIAAQVFDSTDMSVSPQFDYVSPPTKKDPLNNYQQKALQLALGSPVSFIWGPPGTGKTKTIASIIEGYLSQDKSVLLLSHTNKATDEALMATLKYLGDENEDYQNGKIIRFGDITIPWLKDKYVTPDKIAEKNGRGIRDEIKKLEIEVDNIHTGLAEAINAIKKYDRYNAVLENIENIKQYVFKKQNEAKKHKTDIEDLKSQISSLKAEVKSFEQKGAIGRLFTSRKPEQIQGEIASCLRKISTKNEQIDAIIVNIRESKEKFEPLIIERDSLLKELPPESHDYYKDFQKNGKAKISELEKEQRDLEKQLEGLRDSLVLEAKVVATTLTKSYISQTVLARQYDCVIIDEVSMAPLPAVLCATGLAKKNAVLVGDFLQLPPVVKHKVIRNKWTTEDDAQEEARLIHDWLERDIFAIAGIEQGVRTKKNPQKLCQLKRQYRMHQSIADIINLIAYGQFGEEYELETDESTTGNRNKELIAQQPAIGAHVAFYDTSERAPIASILDGGSYYNLYNALVCLEIAKEAVKSGYSSIGIISAYRGQANLISKMLVDTFKDEDKTKVDADTVHRFQGGEKQLIIFDITTANAKSMYDDGSENGNDMKLMNVAISRAKDKCVIVGDMKAILKNHSSSSSVRQIIGRILEKQYPVYNTENILDSYKVLEQSDEWLRKMASSPKTITEMEKSKLYDEAGFYGQFIDDMLSAKREIIIDSPYITTKRVDVLYKYFEQIRHKGVEIYILTRVAKEQDGKMQYYTEAEIERLTKIGIKILPFMGKIHRKLAIIDRKILWEGSLNILSQNDSREVMRRFIGKNSAQQMMSFLKLDKNLGKLGEPALRHCEYCDSPVAWYWTDISFFGGLWTSCLLNRHKEGVPPKTTEQIRKIKTNLKEARKSIKETTADGAPICPHCQIVMIKRSGRFGEFYGCPRYPACKITEKIKK